MNRQERRRAEMFARIKEKEKLLEENKGVSDRIKKLEAEIRDEMSHYYMGLMYTVFVVVMRRACGFGKKRMYRVLNEIAAIINDLHEETITVYDIKREAEAAGMEIKFDVDRNIVVANIFEEVEEKKNDKSGKN